MDSGADQIDAQIARAMLLWQIELGADEALGETPVDRYALPPEAPRLAVFAPPRVEAEAKAAILTTALPAEDPVTAAKALAAATDSLEALAAAQSGYAHCELKQGARNFVFADGNPVARVMVIGEAPGREEDSEGRPFVGRAGQLLDKMFAAIGLSRGSDDPQSALYITNVLPWRPPQNREPLPEEIAMMLPFLARHVDLVDPEVIVLMGNTPCATALGRRGILRLRGTWATAFGRPAMPMTHPAYLLRNPEAKRAAWADLLDISAKLRGRV